MDFITEPVSISEARELIKKYSLTCPYPSSNNIENNITAQAYNKENDALMLPLRGQHGFISNGKRVMDGFDAINILMWRGYRIRVDHYKDIIGDFDEVILTAKSILIPLELEDQKDKIIELVEGGMLSLYKRTLQPADKDRKYKFKAIRVEFTDKDEMWERHGT